MSVSTQDISLDMSLRMWSNSVNLAVLIGNSHININKLHVAGQSFIANKQGKTKIAQRHYVSIEKSRIDNYQGLHDWLVHIVNLVRLNPKISESIGAGQVEALAWIAIFGRQFVSMPRIAPNIVVSCSQLGLKVMLENYTDFDTDGAPKRLWLS